MISVSEAQQQIITHFTEMPVVSIKLAKSAGSYLAENLVAPLSLPSFRQSAMDGYAIIHSETKKLRVSGHVQAGDVTLPDLKAGEAIRIFTGAPVPDAADTVIIQEHVTRDGDTISIEKLPQSGANVRPVGEQISKGEVVLKKGHHINEASIGFMAGLGITEINVYAKPKVSILTTGNELQEPGTILKPNHIYESNGVMLQMALHRLGIEKIQFIKVSDTLEATTQAVKKALDQSDVLLVSGGISVGDFDFVQEAFEANDVKNHFYKVNQKPGKPLWFGTKGDKSVFGLPGNPASSLTCFYAYVLPHLRKRMGAEHPFLNTRKAKLTSAIKNPFGKTLFLKAGVTEDTITPYTGQASSMLNTYALSNALIIVPEECEVLNAGDWIQYIDLNF
ncbi:MULTISPECIES: gephyrin-like molybdotransferase Glp [unclassified Leeuwenhoekiella]|uniref:molybdopterin molybdotransferase MoeA n=1 Tax=unclassified Leeuwenhoekiella TaxID=2615029 RepID=UPI000C6B6232|nr:MULTISPECIES: gephyrin-like molybdotransferase Glp [unclassified Leeuwenhoekiella]MAW95215.1 molybdopterin molybdenumtransferase MoeA [Leeuwenhoekiella sp.]MBA81862.1 molybdopterin molybdenumtransferase MoeA [Leeuwenhoekiella sp.]|tara:strand:+ start:20162 stop:21337 length:1176 start_codon:yes stop_codon:yes gene_type:complete